MQGLQQLRGVLEEAAQACRCCEICGQPGEAVVDGTSQAIGDERGGADPAELRLATVWRLSFTSKTMSLATAKVPPLQMVYVAKASLHDRDEL